MTPLQCVRCGRAGHLAKDCTWPLSAGAALRLLAVTGAVTGSHLVRLMCSPLEDVYAQLVAEEAAGRVRVLADEHGIARWEAMVPPDEQLAAASGIDVRDTRW